MKTACDIIQKGQNLEFTENKIVSGRIAHTTIDVPFTNTSIEVFSDM